MADRNLNFNPDVTNVVTQNPNSLALGIGEIADKVADAAQQSKILMGTAQLGAQYKQLDATFRNDYASDPTNAEGLSALAEARQKAADDYSSNAGISSFYTRQWQTKATDLAEQSSSQNDIWAVRQNNSNALNNSKTAIQSNLDQANQDGRAAGSTGDLSGVTNYLSTQQNLQDSLSKIVGSEKAGAVLQKYPSDYVKSYVSGLAESHPDMASQLLDTPEVADHFTTQERGDMIDQIAKVKKQQQLATDLQTTVNNSQVNDIVNDPTTSFYEKRAKIDQLDMGGSITPQIAAKARRVITSSNNLDTQTDTPTMAGIINQIYDLNSQAQANPSDYLNGIRNIQGTILDKQHTGELTPGDATKLNKQLSDLTSKRVADSTQSVGNTFYDANQKFNTLPPEMRAEATRQLFYNSQGQNWNDKAFSAGADSVLDGINQKRRQNALNTIAKTQQADSMFLGSIKATPADVTATAQKYHISEAEVIRQLRAKSYHGPVKAGNGPADDSAGNNPAAPSAPAEDDGSGDAE